ncbi:beta-lactamase family protein [bacterium AH-315-P15]|nr:beta-lactamase family protein [bacterium AH-315-P15]
MRVVWRIGKWVGGLSALIVVALLGAPFLFLAPIALPTDTPTESTLYDERYRVAAEVARVHLTDIRESLGAPSVSAAIGVGGELVWAETIGYASIEAGAAATHDTQYLIGSVSKSLTATAAMMLAERGALNLDASVGAILPDYPAHAHSITFRQLLGHRGGIRHYRLLSHPPFSEALYNQHFESVTGSLVLFQDDPLTFDPGTDFGYSTFGYTLASAMMEQMKGQSFLDLMDATLFDPLGLSSTEADDRTRTIPHRAADYSHVFDMPVYDGFSSFYIGEGEVIRSEMFDASNKWAGGGFLSTPQDLVHFANALVQGELVSEEGREALFQPAPFPNGEETSYALGWRQLTRSSRQRPDGSVYEIVNHGGTSVGSQCLLIIYVHEEVNLAVCMNAYTGGSWHMLQSAVYMGDGFLDVVEGR